MPLSILHDPICVTFSFFSNSHVVLTDATLQEEQLRESELVVTMNRHGEVCQLAKLGGSPVDALTLLQCTNVALTKVQEISSYITRQLEEDETKRNIGGLIAELSAENER